MVKYIPIIMKPFVTPFAGAKLTKKVSEQLRNTIGFMKAFNLKICETEIEEPK